MVSIFRKVNNFFKFISLVLIVGKKLFKRVIYQRGAKSVYYISIKIFNFFFFYFFTWIFLDCR